MDSLPAQKRRSENLKSQITWTPRTPQSPHHYQAGEQANSKPPDANPGQFRSIIYPTQDTPGTNAMRHSIMCRSHRSPATTGGDYRVRVILCQW